ncbi:MAG TPA: hypothetical protein VFJ06_05310 [Halococcus sp.]|nr:hypothetical protein [Halococcus sp.]
MTAKSDTTDGDDGTGPNNEASEGVETVHRTAGWLLSVREDGSVETHKMGVTRVAPYTTRDEWFGAEGENYRCGKTTEGILARYTHETRFERDPNTEHGAALRDGIISELCATATDATCGRSECDSEAAYAVHTNAPTGPFTALVCDDHATEGTYTTLHTIEACRHRIS